MTFPCRPFALPISQFYYTASPAAMQTTSILNRRLCRVDKVESGAVEYTVVGLSTLTANILQAAIESGG